MKFCDAPVFRICGANDFAFSFVFFLIVEQIFGRHG